MLNRREANISEESSNSSDSEIDAVEFIETYSDDDEEEAADAGTTIVELTKLQSIKEMLTIVIPCSVNEFIINGEFFVKTLIFSKIGSDELAASTLISTSSLLTIATAKAILISTNVYAARAGENDLLLASILQQSWLQATLQSIPLIVVLSFTKSVFDILSQPQDISEIASQYLLYNNIALPAILLLQSNQMFAIGLKRPNLALISTIISTSLTLGLSYILAFGKLGLPELGMTGVAVSTAISSWLSFAGMAAYFAIFDKQIKKLNIFKINCAREFRVLGKMFKTGLPIGLNVLSEFGSYFLMSIMVGTLGKNYLIAEQITAQYSGLLLGPVMATAIATDVLVGHDIASHNARNIKRLAYTGIAIGATISTAGLIVLSSAPKLLASPFLDEEENSYDDILSLLPILFIIIGINNIGEALRNISGGALRGFYDTTVPMLITALIFWVVGLPISYILTFLLGLDVNGIFMGRGIGIFSTGLALFHRWYKKSNDPAVAIQDSTSSLLSKFGVVSSRIKKCCSSEAPETLSSDDEQLELPFVELQVPIH